MRTPHHRTVLSLLCVCAIFSHSVQGKTNKPFEKFVELEAYPFVKLVSNDRVVGTSTSFKGDSVVVVPVTTPELLEKYLEDLPSTSPTSNSFCLVLNSTLFTSENMEKINKKEKIGAVAVLTSTDEYVTEYSPVDQYPQKAQGLHPTSSHIWNPLGNDMRYQNYRVVVIALNNKDSEIVLQAAQENENNKFSFPRKALLIDSFMFAAKDATTCLRRDHCMPVGGISAWGMFGTFPPANTDEFVVLSTAGDSDGMFYRKAPGADSGISGATAVLAAAKALANIEVVHTSSRHVLVSLLGAEAFGHMGSRRFVLDILDFKCERGKAADHGPGEGVSCSKPYVSDTAFQFISLTQVVAVIEPTMVGNPSPSKGFVVHSEPLQASQDMATQFVEIATQKNKQATKSQLTQLPPSTSEVFVRSKSNLPAIVVSDFDEEFTNKFYFSRLDKNINSSHVCECAQILAITALHTVTNTTSYNSTLADLVHVDCDWVAKVVDCFTNNLVCPLLQNYSYPSDFNGTTWADDEGRANLYTSVFRPTSDAANPLISFAHLLLAQITSPPSFVPNTCSNDKDCMSRGRCVEFKCTNGTSHLHRAISPAFDYDASESYSINQQFVDQGDTTWTESTWQSLGLKLHLQESFALELGMFFLGCGLTGLTIAVVSVVSKSYKRFIFGMQ